MRPIKLIAEEAKKTGVVWLGGEMEIPANQGAAAAFAAACRVAEVCGYIATWKYRGVAFSVAGGEIPGEVILDWFSPEAKDLVKIEVWTSVAEYLK